MNRYLRAATLAFSFAACGMGQVPGDFASRPGAGAEAPAVIINASPQRVEQVVIARASVRGSTIRPSSDGSLVLERKLDRVTPQVAAACGESLFGRTVRVVMRVTPVQGGTRLSEERFIVGATFVGGSCAMPLSAADMAQSMASLNAVKVQAEMGNASMMPAH